MRLRCGIQQTLSIAQMQYPMNCTLEPKNFGAERILARCGLYSQPFEATDVLIAFKLIATATKYIEGTLEQTVLQPACC